jgi:long-chain acyl-CoA synthetase
MGQGGSKSSSGPLGQWGPAGPNDAALGVSPVLRSAIVDVASAPPTTDAAGNATLWPFMAAAFAKNAERRSVGWRKLMKREMEDNGHGKSFEKLTLAGEFDYWTYQQLDTAATELAAGLVAKTGLKTGDRVLIFAETQRDWMVSALACFRQGAIVVTAYATLGEEGVVTSLNQTEASTVVCDAKLFKIVLASAPQCASLKHVVTILTEGPADDGAETSGGMSEKLGPAIDVHTVGELQAAGKAAPCPADSSVKAKDTAVIMYTSGTTGSSKGVVLSHEACIAMTLSYPGVLSMIGPEDVFIGYLPLAHIMELCVEFWLLSVGATIGYGSPHTLTDTGVKLKKGCQGDAPLLRPTVMLFAPAVLDKVYAAVQRKANASAMAKSLFSRGLAAGKVNFDNGHIGAGMFWNSALFHKVQALVGGRVRMMATGSAPLSPDIQCYIQSCFSCPVRQGYGCTETCGGSAIGHYDDNTVSQVGPPTPCTYIRLRDWEEGNYRNSDLNDPAIGARRGEVLIGGPSICDGYYVCKANPDPEIIKKNSEDFIEIDGIRYFCTGDVGMVDARGCIKIVDRKKDLFKGASGEYVALSKVEAALKLSPFVEFPMVYGKTGAAGVIGLICPQKPSIESLMQELKITEAYGPAVLKNKDVVAAVSKALAAACKSAGLLPFETPSAFALVCAEDGQTAWTPENDLLTTTMKLKRPAIAKLHAAEIEACYAK